MEWNFFSFFLNNEEAFIKLNPNLLETNLVNILILIGLLVYANKTQFSVTLEIRRNKIIQTIENAQKDAANALNYYYLAEKGYSQSIFWLQSWRAFYQKDKVDFVHNKYKFVKNGLLETFVTTENLIANSEIKALLSLRKYMLFMVGSRILRKFFDLTKSEQSKFIGTTISKLGGSEE
jgi:F0F1-type ATP synthase membrane subunit b/b'